MRLKLREDHARWALQGQITVIFALMVIVIIAFTGMAIDLAHARAVAEDEQRAANAGALAGVVYLPGSPSNATSNAAALTTSNNFTDNCSATSTCSASGAVQIVYTANGPARTLREQITEQVPTTFLRVLGIKSISVVRAATATYADPITLGAPDHVLGFAPYPTNAVTLCTGSLVLGSSCQSNNPYGQGFYLEVRGSWAGVEHGDAFSPYFENYNGDCVKTTNGATSICNSSPTLTGCNSADSGVSYNNICQDASSNNYHLAVNPMYNQQDPSSTLTGGYNFVFAFPAKMTSPALIKLFDPYDECFHTASPPAGTVTAPDGTPSGAAQTQQVSSQYIDQCGKSFFTNPYATSLRFTLSEPTDQLVDADKAPVAAAGTDLNGSLSPAQSGWQVTTSSNPETFGGDPATTTSHGWQWFSFASFQNNTNKPMYVRLNVAATANGDGSSGTGGNDFSLGICKAVGDPSAGSVGNMPDSTAWQTGATSGTAPTYGTETGVDLGCADPNIGTTTGGVTDTYGCGSGGGNSCYHVSALNSFCLETLQQNPGDGVIPLAQIDQHFANADITLRLFDAGDINNGNNLVNILGPDTNLAGPTYESFAMDLSAPSGSGYSTAGSGRTAGGAAPNSFFGDTTNGINSCPPDYNAASYPNGDGPICPPLTALTQAGGGINTGVYPSYNSNHSFGNGTWMDFHIHVPSGYNPAATDEWWKVLYDLPSTNIGGATDTTTWEVVSGAAPVHLLSVS